MEMPYCETCSKPDFHTSVTSQALLAWRRHDRKAETAFPPTEHTLISSLSSVAPAMVTALGADTSDACGSRRSGGSFRARANNDW